jgi:hypothetical protein
LQGQHKICGRVAKNATDAKNTTDAKNATNAKKRDAVIIFRLEVPSRHNRFLL